jgi:hypothetical protein
LPHSETPIDRALGLIDPRPEKRQRCRELLIKEVNAITADPGALPSPKILKAELATAAKSLQSALRAIKKLPRTRQRVLLVPLPPVQGGSSLISLLQASKRTEVRLERFLDQLDYAAAVADKQAKSISVPRTGGRPNYQKQAAAEWALILLAAFSRRRPTLTAGGVFFELANTIYEAATDKRDVDLSRQCRTAYHDPRPQRRTDEQRRN